MTRILLAIAALAMGLGVAQADGPHQGRFNWSGLYLGANIGTVTDGGSTYTYTVAGNFEPAGRPRPNDMDGMLYGAQIGYQYQLPVGLVVGVEAAALFGNTDALLLENPAPTGNDYRTTTDGGPIYIVAGRLGFALDRLLLYAKGGWAWTETDFQATFYNRDGPMGSNGSQVKIANTFEWDGFVWGAGAEFALARNITVGVEYMRMDFGTSDVVTLKTTNSGITQEKLRASHEIETVTARLNYRF